MSEPTPFDLQLLHLRETHEQSLLQLSERYEQKISQLEQRIARLEHQQATLTTQLQQANQRAKFSVDTLETIPHPSIRVDDHNLIHRINDLAQTTFGYRLSDLEGRSIFTLIHEGELQILELAAHYEELRTFLGHKDLDEIPVTFLDKTQQPHLLAADIRFQGGQTTTYHGATLSFQPRPKHLLHRIMPTSHTILKAQDYCNEDGVFTNYNTPLADGRVFGNLVIAPFVSVGKGRRKITIIDLEGISRCGDEVYDFLAKIQSHFHQSDPSFDIRVYTADASLAAELYQRGFPQENISSPKKTTKKKEK